MSRDRQVSVCETKQHAGHFFHYQCKVQYFKTVSALKYVMVRNVYVLFFIIFAQRMCMLFSLLFFMKVYQGYAKKLLKCNDFCGSVLWFDSVHPQHKQPQDNFKVVCLVNSYRIYLNRNSWIEVIKGHSTACTTCKDLWSLCLYYWMFPFLDPSTNLESLLT